MSRFETVDDQYDASGVEDRVAEWWEAIDAYEQTKRHREGGEEFFFVVFLVAFTTGEADPDRDVPW